MFARIRINVVIFDPDPAALKLNKYEQISLILNFSKYFCVGTYLGAYVLEPIIQCSEPRSGRSVTGTLDPVQDEKFWVTDPDLQPYYFIKNSKKFQKQVQYIIKI